jgi:hypothetical protein
MAKPKKRPEADLEEGDETEEEDDMERDNRSTTWNRMTTKTMKVRKVKTTIDSSPEFMPRRAVDPGLYAALCSRNWSTSRNHPSLMTTTNSKLTLIR